MKTEYNDLYELLSRYEQHHMPMAGADFAEEDDDEEKSQEEIIEDIKELRKQSSGLDNNKYFGVYKYWLIHEPFCYFLEVPWNPKDISWLKWTNIDHKWVIKIFLGWKFQFIKKNETERAMLALFAWPFRHPDV